MVADLNGTRAEQVAHSIAGSGGTALAIQTNVSQAVQVEAMVAAAEKAFGAVDVLVNNAAGCEGNNLASLPESTWDQDMNSTLKSVYLCSKRVLPGMIARRQGVIVNIASVNGLAYFGNEAYSAAKAGVISLTQSMATRYGQYGIRANAVAPGTVRTPIWQERIERDPKVMDRLKKWYPLGRVGEPEDIASAVIFLASDAASWITGIVLRVDGGLMAGNPLMTRELLVESQEGPTWVNVHELPG